MAKVYGYCRISTPQQNIERQIRNISDAAPGAVIFKEATTGTKLDGRKELDKLLKVVQPGDTIVFDAVDRLARNAAEGVALYQKLYAEGVELHFLKQPTVNTEVYRKAASDMIPMTGTTVDYILKGVNKFLEVMQQQQITAAFESAQAEVDALHQRTREGIETARRAGKQIGGVTGRKLHTKKSDTAKKIIREHAAAFGGSLNDAECMKLAGLARNTYYKYKAELKQEEV